MEVEAALVSCGCNRSVSAAAWGPCNLVAFGAHNGVAIFCPQSAKLVHVLPGHKDLVNCIEWLPRHMEGGSKLEEQYLLSGSADGVIMLWAHNQIECKWRHVVQLPKSHQKAVTCIASLMTSPQGALIASTASDCTVCLWNAILPATAGGECKVSMAQSIPTGPRAIVAVALGMLPASADGILLAMGGLDNHIRLYCKMEVQFSPACVLKGHQDWIRSLDFSSSISDGGGGQVVFLASSAQDKTIRIWRIGPKSLSAGRKNSEEQGLPSIKMFIEGPVFRAGSVLYQASMESVLTGHDDWVYSVKWQPPAFERAQNGAAEQARKAPPMSLLSASMDRTMMIWRPDPMTGLWLNEVTVGELGHTALGFYGGLWSPHGDAILAHAFGGSFHMWGDVGAQVPDWQPQLVPSGHSGSVVDVAWAKSGQFLLSTSHDQTTRLFVPWDWSKQGEALRPCSWHEIARPQVHGHGLNCLAVVRGSGNHQFVSGAEEKVARVFEAPVAFLKTLEHTKYGSQDCVRAEDVKVLGANMSALGLSQKPIYSSGSQPSKAVNSTNTDGMDAVPDALPTVLTRPPLEEHLGWNTLWPESHKLYGHGNELFSMCCDHRGSLLATACKAQSANMAEIWLWQVDSWKAVQQLPSHTLTVTQLEFSHNDKFLLSVSRDRNFSVFRAIPGKQFEYELVSRVEAHKRIIWSCSWTPCDRFFATGSRDKSVKLWAIQEIGDELAVKQLGSLPLFKSSVTAVAWAPSCTQGKDQLLSIGMEDGLLELWKVTPVWATVEDGSAGMGSIVCFETARFVRFDAFLCHVASVNRLRWSALHDDKKGGSQDLEHGDKKVEGSQDLEHVQLASCGADHTVRVFSFKSQ